MRLLTRSAPDQVNVTDRRGSIFTCTARAVYRYGKRGVTYNRPYNKNLQRAQVFITYLRAFFLAVAERSLKWYSLTLVLLWPLLLCKVPSAILCELPLCSVPSFL